MQTVESITQFFETQGVTPLDVLNKLGGYYECPKDKNGNRLGYMVGYAAKYSIETGEKQYVGDVYINCAVAEQYPCVMDYFGRGIFDKAKPSGLFDKVDVFCGPQMGGILVAQILAFGLNRKFAYIEKITTQLATSELREQSRLGFLRHAIEPGERVVIAEDVLNNFSTTKETIAAIEEAGGEVIGICAIVNRSKIHVNAFQYAERSIPIIALIEKAFDQYRQDDPAVVDDIAKGKVILKPKNEWTKLNSAVPV